MRCLHFTLCVTALAATLATPLTATPAVADDQWTVLTMAPDGSWGAATSAGACDRSRQRPCQSPPQRTRGRPQNPLSGRPGWAAR